MLVAGVGAQAALPELLVVVAERVACCTDLDTLPLAVILLLLAMVVLVIRMGQIVLLLVTLLRLVVALGELETASWLVGLAVLAEAAAAIPIPQPFRLVRAPLGKAPKVATVTVPPLRDIAMAEAAVVPILRA